uniref:Uncharacterized protein n=1 Tax=Rangifer tarandus platyrhynchus TaxID=3082113 RepID=A0ACB0FF73_RANTA|nr:unnamed protein product [Rangifer tarandus platyrhynchus]
MQLPPRGLQERGLEASGSPAPQCGESAAPRGRRLSEAGFAHLGAAATARLPLRVVDVRAERTWLGALAAVHLGAAATPTRRFQKFASGRRALGMGQHRRAPGARLLPAPRRGSLEPAWGGRERPFSGLLDPKSASVRRAEGTRPQRAPDPLLTHGAQAPVLDPDSAPCAADRSFVSSGPSGLRLLDNGAVSTLRGVGLPQCPLARKRYKRGK